MVAIEFYAGWWQGDDLLFEGDPYDDVRDCHKHVIVLNDLRVRAHQAPDWVVVKATVKLEEVPLP